MLEQILISDTNIQNKIYLIRNQKVMLDFDLATLYEVETRALKQSVKRNLIRFPEDFMFQLTKNEWTEVITICDNLPRNIKFSPSTPYAFTEQGVAMLSSILNSDRAIIVNNLKGMKIVKEKLAVGNIKYKEPGQIISDLAGLPGINIYVLGPPLSWDVVKKEAGGLGESYPHNNELTKSDAFASAVLADTVSEINQALPFDKKYVIQQGSSQWNAQQRRYFNDETEWQNIDFEWLQSAGMLALRVNSMTNNLSLALAFEVEATGKVLLLPGDAEYGSWLSWHMINWQKTGFSTEDLLNRTIFYKVAHHMSHNGTAQRCGLEMMTDPGLSAMATLDYNIIAPGWTSTMPNGAMTESLIRKTRGRLMIMQEKDLYMDRGKTTTVADRIVQERTRLSAQESADFKKNCASTDLYHQMTITL